MSNGTSHANFGFSQLKLSAPNATLVLADTAPTPSADLSGRSGWLYTKTALAEKMNLYFYYGAQETTKVRDIKSIFMLGSIEQWAGLQNQTPHYVVYTKPTGVDDAFPFFYHSKRSYSINLARNVIRFGEKCIFFVHTNPSQAHESMDFLGARTIKMDVTADVGDFADDQEILYITLHTSSESTDASLLVQRVGAIFQSNGFSGPTAINARLLI
mgnify:CR=1 FL=1|tara:strand:- start:3799 stop:4440 length:642 start_codon:yes stop_codon:yes gene_type:complete